MIELPDAPMQADVTPITSGFLQRNVLGAINGRIDRKGDKYSARVSAGPFEPEAGRQWASNLLAGTKQKARMRLPLQWSQGSPGACVVDGAGQGGTSLNLRGVTPGYSAKNGFFLSIENANGQHFVHSLIGSARAAANGIMAVTLNEQLREPFLDGAAVHLAKPMIEGWILPDELAWNFSVDRVFPINFIIEEAK